MEYENKYSNYSSNAKGNLGVTLGAIGTGLGVLGGSNLLGLFNNGNCNGTTWNAGGCCSEDHYVNRYELSQENEIARLRTEVSLRDSNTYTMNQLNLFRNYVDNRFSGIEQQLCQQQVVNATTISNLSCLQQQVAQLQSLTKLVIPSTNVCTASTT